MQKRRLNDILPVTSVSFFDFYVDPIAILAGGREVLSSNAVINSFVNNSFSFNCLGTTENRNLLWESRNISTLSDGEILIEDTETLQGLTVTYVINTGIFFLNRSFIILFANRTEFFNGYYSCKSQQSNDSVEIYTTLINPLWQVVPPHIAVVPMGADVTITLQYGDSSVGYQNNGGGFRYSLMFLPCVATLPDELLQTGISKRFSNQLVYSFQARLNDDSGEFLWNGKM